MDIAALTVEELANSYGDALKGLKIGQLDGTDSIFVDAQFAATDDSWQETTIKISVGDYEVRNYDRVTYELYLETGNFGELTAAFAISDKYDFGGLKFFHVN